MTQFFEWPRYVRMMHVYMMHTFCSLTLSLQPVFSSPIKSSASWTKRNSEFFFVTKIQYSKT